MYQQSRIVDGSTTGVIPPTRELLTTALPPQRCGGLDLRNGGWTFSTFCSMDKCCLRTFDGSQRRSFSTCFRRTVSVPSFHCEEKRPLRIQACSNTQLGCSSSAGCLARGSGQRRPDSFSLPFRYNVRQQHQQLRPLSQRTFLCPVNEQAPAQPWKSPTCHVPTGK